MNRNALNEKRNEAGEVTLLDVLRYDFGRRHYVADYRTEQQKRNQDEMLAIDPFAEFEVK